MKKVFILSILMCFAIVAQAQFSQFHAGLVLPTGKFGEGDPKKHGFGEGRGFAATGFTIGYKNYFPMSTENLSGVFGVSLFFNGLNSDIKDLYDDYDGDVTLPKYLNFPVTFGLNYAFPLQESIKIYGEVAIGGNLSMPTKWKESDDDWDYEIKHTPAFGFAWALEGGAFINDKFSIGIRINNLGSYKYKIEWSDGDEKEKDKYSKALPITGISLCLGILF